MIDYCQIPDARDLIETIGNLRNHGFDKSQTGIEYHSFGGVHKSVAPAIVVLADKLEALGVEFHYRNDLHLHGNYFDCMLGNKR